MLFALLSAAQTDTLSVSAPETLSGKKGETITADFTMRIRTGYHVNSNTPTDPYLIPLKFTFAQGAAEAVDVVFPKPKLEKYQFAEQPLSVFTGDFKTQVKFKIAANAPGGMQPLTGKVRYQACNDKMCLPPRTVEVKVPLFVR